VQATLENWRTAPIDARTRAMLGFIEKLTLNPDAVSAGDIQPLRAERLSDAAIEDAIHVCTLFSVYDRLADSFEFDIPDASGFEKSARTLLDRGYA
jgi:alkylhydroperoxidase family enzyme